MWDKARFTVYVTMALGGVFSLFMFAGYGRFDWETYTFYPDPIDARLMATWVGGAAANLMAAIAVVRGWGSRWKRG